MVSIFETHFHYNWDEDPESESEAYRLEWESSTKIRWTWRRRQECERLQAEWTPLLASYRSNEIPKRVTNIRCEDFLICKVNPFWKIFILFFWTPLNTHLIGNPLVHQRWSQSARGAEFACDLKVAGEVLDESVLEFAVDLLFQL
jgi:hypothetical protein